MIDAATNQTRPLRSAGARRFSLTSSFLARTRQRGVPLAVFAFTHLLFAILGFTATRILTVPKIHGNSSVLPHSDILARLGTFASDWFRFDAYWFVNVAQHGYHWATAGKANTNFLPLYPALIRMLEPLALGSPWLAAWLVSSVFSLVSLVLLWEWACKRWSREVATRTVILFAVFPFAFFFAAPYSESLFVA